jgi:hypothetical protein
MTIDFPGDQAADRGTLADASGNVSWLVIEHAIPRLSFFYWHHGTAGASS